MGRAIHLFNTETEYTNKRTNDYSEPWVSLTLSENRVDYNKVKQEPLTFKILSDGNVKWEIKAVTGFGKTIEYSKNGGEWISINADNSTPIPVVVGDILKFRGNIWPGNYSSSTKCGFSSTCSFNVSGNPISLKYGENIYGDEQLVDYCFTSLFHNCTNLISASELQLPATTLTYSCYNSMFFGCSSLIEAPVLPATTLANYCYNSMFCGCTSLTISPVLPAPTLANSCYNNLFYNCISMIKITCLAIDFSADGALSNWITNIPKGVGTFYKAAGSSFSSIPRNWTVVEI